MNKRKQKITIIAFMVAIMSTISVSFAWFINNTNVSIKNVDNNTVEVGQSLEISLCTGKDSNNKDVWSPFVNKKLEFSTPLLQDVTGDGISFQCPYTLDSKDNAVYPLMELNSNNREGYFLEFKLKVRSKSQMSLYLSNESYVLPVTTDKNVNTSIFSGDSDASKFTANYIAGAARVSVTEITKDGEDEIETLKQLWIPNDKYQLSFSSSNTASFTPNGSRESEYKYYYNDFQDLEKTICKQGTHIYESLDYIKKQLVVGDQLANPYTNMTNGSSAICDFPTFGAYDERIIVLRLWIEGSDREAQAPLNQGQIKFNISLCGIANKTDDSSASDYDKLTNLKLGTNHNDGYLYDLDGNKIDAEDELYYSINGIDWILYGQLVESQIQGLTDFYTDDIYVENGTSRRKYFYLKQKETMTEEHSTVFRIDFENRTISKYYSKVGD